MNSSTAKGTGHSSVRSQLAESVAALMARHRARQDERPRKLAAVREELRGIEALLVDARRESRLRELIHDATAAEVQLRADALATEWTRLLHRCVAVDVCVGAGHVLIVLARNGAADISIRLTPTTTVEVQHVGGTLVDIPPHLRITMVEQIADLRLIDVVETVRTAVYGVEAMEASVDKNPHPTDPPTALFLEPWIKSLKAAQAEVDSAQRATDELERRWSIASRRERELYVDAMSAASTASTSQEASDRKLVDRILAIPVVRGVSLKTGDVLMVTTYEVRIRESGVDYALGEYLLRLHFGSARVEILAQRPANSRGVDHPHVLRGAPCFGTHASELRAFWRDMDIVGIVRFCLAFLHSYNPGSPYLPIENWPLEVKE